MAASMRKVLAKTLRLFETNKVYSSLRFISSSNSVCCKRIDNVECNNNSVETKKPIETTSEEDKPSKLGGFAKAFAKFTDRLEEQHRTAVLAKEGSQAEEQSFAKLFRNSAFVQLGDIKGQIVIGKIFHIVEDDLYIDFGGKFFCVCVKPQENAWKYARGAKVRLRLRDFELAEHFLGATKDLTLLEADAQLLGLHESQKPTTEIQAKPT